MQEITEATEEKVFAALDAAAIAGTLAQCDLFGIPINVTLEGCCDHWPCCTCHARACPLTIRSSRCRFAARLNSGVRRQYISHTMTEEYLRNIRDEFGITLPTCYVAFMRDYPSELETTKLNLGWCQEAISERQFLKSPDGVLDLNRGVRGPDIPWLPDDSGWPSRFFVIGDDECGNYYVIDTETDSGAVHFYDHDERSFTQQHGSLRAFAEQMIQETLEFNREQHRDA